MSNPYNYSLSDTDLTEITFITQFGISYLVYLTDGSSYFSDYPEFNQRIFMFGFKPDQTLNRRDPRVKDTILDFLTKYFEQKPETALIFVCDTSDKRQDARFKMFNNWFTKRIEKSTYNSVIHKTNISFCDENESNCAHASLLISGQNTMLNMITTAFLELDTTFRAKYEDE